MQGYIYKLELLEDTLDFKKGEIYIGKHNGIKGNYFGSGKLITSIVKKYGKEILNCEIISKDIDSDELLSYLERYYIKFYNCNRSRSNIGLNLTDGGEGIHGFKKSKEQCEAMSIRIKQEYIENKRISPKLKKVYKYSLETGELLEIFNNCTLASINVNCAASSIAYCARGEMKSCKGFHWSYEKYNNYKPGIYNKKPVLQYDLDMNFIKEWDSATDVKNELGFNNSSITNCCKNISKTSYNYIWRYKES